MCFGRLNISKARINKTMANSLTYHEKVPGWLMRHASLATNNVLQRSAVLYLTHYQHYSLSISTSSGILNLSLLLSNAGLSLQTLEIIR